VAEDVGEHRRLLFGWGKPILESFLSRHTAYSSTDSSCKTSSQQQFPLPSFDETEPALDHCWCPCIPYTKTFGIEFYKPFSCSTQYSKDCSPIIGRRCAYEPSGSLCQCAHLYAPPGTSPPPF
jgi:hypothetical protein